MSTWKDKRKGYWRYGFQFLGKRYTGSGYKDRREAYAAEAKRREEEAAAQSLQEKTGTTFFEASKLYLDHQGRLLDGRTHNELPWGISCPHTGE